MATETYNPTSSAVCHRGATRPRVTESVGVIVTGLSIANHQARATYAELAKQLESSSKEYFIMIQTLASTTPVLAAGWSLLYLLLGGGLGGAALIFLGLKFAGR